MFLKIKQYFCIHDWTSNAMQGIPPDPKDAINIVNFFKYSTMYCSKCGKINELSIQHLKQVEAENDKR